MPKKVCLITSNELCQYDYGYDHPMKPERIRMVYDMLKGLDIADQFQIEQAQECTNSELQIFHSDEYIDFMQNYNKYQNNENLKNKYNIGVSTDTPAFNNFFDFAKLVAGSSLLSAKLLADQKYDLVLNWIGGLHHAHEKQASGFCYVNDCVLAIKQLLSFFKKVMYVDIDVHHGDGVEEAFLFSNRVLTFSVHQFGDNFFPKTGSLGQEYPQQFEDHVINIPLRKGCSDKTFLDIFKNTFDRAYNSFKPDAIVLQCGADSVIGDKLGQFNVSLKGHAEAFNHVRRKNVPLLCLGGGGYTQENVARCWALESANSVGVQIPDNKLIPSELEYRSHYTSNKFYYSPKPQNQFEDLNNNHYIGSIYQEVYGKLEKLHTTFGFIERPYVVGEEIFNSDDFPEIVNIDQNLNPVRQLAFQNAQFRNCQLIFKEKDQLFSLRIFCMSQQLQLHFQYIASEQISSKNSYDNFNFSFEFKLSLQELFSNDSYSLLYQQSNKSSSSSSDIISSESEFSKISILLLLKCKFYNIFI